MSVRLSSCLAAGVISGVLAGCAWPGRPVPPVPAPPEASAPATWQAPLPHGGRTEALAAWWSRLDDELLPRLVAAAQAANPSVAAAASRLAQARATAVVAGAALLPRLDAVASITRTRPDPVTALATSGSASLAASWEIDVFGAASAGRDAAAARLQAEQAGWHDARVAVAAEVAQQLLALRACEAQLQQSQADAASRAETARLTELTERAGFQSPANAALARASAAQGRSAVLGQQASCDLRVKALVELTGLDEASLRAELAPRRARLPSPAALAVPELPARLLQQRPDVARASRELQAAAAELAQSRAQQRPALSISGSFGRGRIESGGFSRSGNVWALGPLQLTMPLFDGGRLAAAESAAAARVDEAGALLRARVRAAVREVEEALVSLDAAAGRRADVQAAAEGFEASLRGTEARYRGGLASLFELEDARRSALQARSALIDLQREQAGAWISLYKALGGGWTAADAGP